MSSQSSHHPQEVLLAQFSLYVHKGGLKPDSFHFILPSINLARYAIIQIQCRFRMNHKINLNQRVWGIEGLSSMIYESGYNTIIKYFSQFKNCYFMWNLSLMIADIHFLRICCSCSLPLAYCSLPLERYESKIFNKKWNKKNLVLCHVCEHIG